MALLNISEPGQSRPKHQRQHKFALGIDLGTTHSLVAVSEHGSSKTLPVDKKMSHLLPSVVHYREGADPVVGEAAKSFLLSDPANTVASVKRLMGRGAADLDYVPDYELLIPDSGGMPSIKTAAGEVSPVEVSAEILRVLAEVGKSEIGKQIEGAVITVPAYFDEAQRQATKDAATIAGINVLRLLSEPTAAAVAYGLDEKLEGTVIIYDLGGGTFDVSLMQLQQGVFQVLATGGDTALGGDDVDRSLMRLILERAGKTDRSPEKHSGNLQKLANDIKHRLTDEQSVEVEYSGWKGIITREDFNACIDPLIDKTLKACRRVLRDADIPAEEITEVVLVGGSTRSPRVQEKVSDFFDRKPLCSIDPDKVVAIGAAKQADVLAGNKYGDDMLLLDVLPLSLGVETMGGLMEKIIPRNTPIPVARAQEFTTFKDGQTVMNLHVLQGERELVSDCRSLARFELHDIPPMVAGAAKVRVTFQVDADGLTEVQAEEINSGVSSSVVVKPSFGLSDQDIEQMIRSSFEEAGTDKEERKIREAQVEALRLIEALEIALAQEGEALLSNQEYNNLEQALAELKSVADSKDADTVERLTEALNELSRDFASRRMDKSISGALSGHSIEELEKE